jgi:hypothetical protein
VLTATGWYAPRKEDVNVKDGDAKSRKKAKAHTRYKTDQGQACPGITTVLGILDKPALIRWANNLGLDGINVKDFVSDLAQIGSLGHALVTDKLVDTPTDTSDYSVNQIDSAMNAALSFWEWEKEHHIDEVYWVEKPLVSNTYRFGGTADIYCRIGELREIIELKTGKGIFPEHKYQGAVQRILAQENGYPVDRVRVLNIEKELEVGWEIFKHCLGIYYLKKGG